MRWVFAAIGTLRGDRPFGLGVADMSKVKDFVASAPTAQTRAPANLVSPAGIATVQPYNSLYLHKRADQMVYLIDHLYCGLSLKALQVEMDEIKAAAEGGSIKKRIANRKTAETLSHVWIAMAGTYSGCIDQQATTRQKKVDVRKAMLEGSANYQITTEEMAQWRTPSLTSLEFIKANVRLAG